MFVGMDVYHDPKGKSPSVTALVASINRFQTKYFSRIVRQPVHQETMDALRGVFGDALQEFHNVIRILNCRLCPGYHLSYIELFNT